MPSSSPTTSSPGEVTGSPGPPTRGLPWRALPARTSTIRLGTLVTSATFRLPGMLAVQVAQVDAMSGGRVELGLGTGWMAEEHTAYGVPFPAKQFGLLEEQLEIITGMWSTPVGERFSHDGAHYQLSDSPALPKPVQDPLPIIIGGGGMQNPAAPPRPLRPRVQPGLPRQGPGPGPARSCPRRL